MLLKADAAFQHVMHKVLPSKGFIVIDYTKLNDDRHALIKCKKKGLDSFFYFYCLFKLAKFHKFSEKFPHFVNEFPSLAGEGESINEGFLEYAINRDAILLYVYPEGDAWGIYAKAVQKICIEKKLTRTQIIENEVTLADFNKTKSKINEKTYSFPVKLMDRFY